MSNAVTAMEVWLLACMMLVFFSLVEYTIILRRNVAHNRALEIMKRDTNIIKNFNGVSAGAGYSNWKDFKRGFKKLLNANFLLRQAENYGKSPPEMCKSILSSSPSSSYYEPA